MIQQQAINWKELVKVFVTFATVIGKSFPTGGRLTTEGTWVGIRTLGIRRGQNAKQSTLLLLYYFTGTDADTDTCSQFKCSSISHWNCPKYILRCSWFRQTLWPPLAPPLRQFVVCVWHWKSCCSTCSTTLTNAAKIWLGALHWACVLLSWIPVALTCKASVVDEYEVSSPWSHSHCSLSHRMLKP